MKLESGAGGKFKCFVKNIPLMEFCQTLCLVNLYIYLVKLQDTWGLLLLEYHSTTHYFFKRVGLMPPRGPQLCS